jgi:plasmid replication initiation protein
MPKPKNPPITDPSAAVPADPEATNQPKPRQGIDEMNLAVLPITRLSRQDDRTTIEFKGTYTDDQGRQRQTRWLVQAGPTGLPSEIGNDILIALLTQGYEDGSLTDQLGHQRQYFTTYQILQALGLSTGIENYKLVETTIKQIHEISLTSENLWIETLPNGKTRQRRSSAGLHITSDYRIYHESDDTDPNKEFPYRSHITWSDMFLRSLRSGYIKQIDLTLYFALASPLAKRLYRFIDKMTALAPEKPYEIDIFDLANRLGMQPYNKANQLRRNLKRALDELVEQRYLHSYEFLKVGKYARVRILRPHAYTVAPPTPMPAQLPLLAAKPTAPLDTAPEPTPEQALWAATLAELSTTIVEHLLGVHLVSITAGVATLSPTRQQDWLLDRGQAKIIRALRTAGAEVERLAFLPLSA